MLERVKSLLKEAIGLDATSLGAGAIERALRDRQLARGLADPEAYWTLLSLSPDELQELIEAVVVPETWFFRDREAFQALTQRVLPEWLSTHADGTLRLLSMPCSTGEEAYSLSMALLAAGLPASRFRIDAVDISERALSVARAAYYRRNSFRGQPLDFRDRFFEPEAEGWRLRASVSAPVHLRRGNLFDEKRLAGQAAYDVIFCRNVLIYFDRDTQDRAMGVLADLLAPAGALFVGPSEAGLALSHGWTSARVPLSFAFRRPAAARTIDAAAVPVDAPAPPATRTPAPPPRRPAPRAAAAPPRVPANAASRQDLLARAQALADQGQLAPAAQCCEDVLARHGPDATAFYLLGLVRDAAGDARAAAQHYRKALYLDPAHGEALAHLALILERQGDAPAARVLRERASRHAGAAERAR